MNINNGLGSKNMKRRSKSDTLETDRQTDRQRETDRQIETDRQTDRQTETRHTHRERKKRELS